MEFEDSKNALFVEPNAYIQKFDCDNKKEIKKVVFQEPYECLPNYYLNNNFKKKDCNCIKQHNACDKQKKEQCDCNKPNNVCKDGGNSFGQFDFKNILPLFLGLNKGGNDLSFITNMLSNNKGDGFNFSNIISTVLQNPKGISNMLNIFKGGVSKKKQSTKQIKTTDFQIKNYTRV